MHPVRASFMEFWPPAVISLALPHVAIPLRPHEIAALTACHRTGCDGAGALENLAIRADLASRDQPFFLRLGHGSWALPQMAQFGSLEITTAERAHAVLALRDLRLAEISRRWVQGYQPHLFVRAYLPPTRRREVRSRIEAGFAVKAWMRHAPAVSSDIPDLAQVVARHLPAGAVYTVDCMATDSGWFLSDINPVLKASIARPGQTERA
jgi:hypothetical protein